MNDRLPTIEDSKQLVKDILEALDQTKLNAKYSMVLNWRIVVPTALTAVQLSTVLRKTEQALAQYNPEFLSNLEFKISEYDEAGIELVDNVKKIQQARSVSNEEPKEEQKTEVPESPKQE